MSSQDDGFADSIFSHRKRMESISEIVEGELYLSSLVATSSLDKLQSKHITHIVSILKEPFTRHADMEYLVVGEDDSADTDLLKYFEQMNAFIGTYLSIAPSISLCRPSFSAPPCPSLLPSSFLYLTFHLLILFAIPISSLLTHLTPLMLVPPKRHGQTEKWRRPPSLPVRSLSFSHCNDCLSHVQ